MGPWDPNRWLNAVRLCPSCKEQAKRAGIRSTELVAQCKERHCFVCGAEGDWTKSRRCCRACAKEHRQSQGGCINSQPIHAPANETSLLKPQDTTLSGSGSSDNSGDYIQIGPGFAFPDTRH